MIGLVPDFTTKVMNIRQRMDLGFIKEKIMSYKRNLWNILILLLVFTIPFTQCKKSSTSPDVNALTCPVIWLNTFDISFTACESGANPFTQTLQIKNSGQQTLDYTLSSETEWVSFSPAEGSSTGQINNHTISVSKAGLAARNEDYTAKILVTCDQAYNNPQEVHVSLKISKQAPPEIWVNTKDLTFSAQEGAANPPSQNILIRNNREGILKYEISVDSAWLTVTPLTAESESAEKTHTVTANISGLKAGAYTGTITITDANASNSPHDVKVSLNVTKEPPPEICKDRNVLSFEAMLGGADPSSQSFFIENSGGGTLNYVIDWDAPWLGVNPTSGATDGPSRKHTASVNTGGLGAGTYQGTIVITDPKASNSPQTIGVTLHISSPLTDDKVGISFSPKEGGTDSTVTITVSVKGNASPISDGFGLQLHYDPSIFQYQSTNHGILTNSWAAVDGNANSGTIIVGGFRGSGSVIPIGSQGSIAVVKLKVIHNGSSDLSTTINMNSLTDDLVGMKISPASATFTYRH